MVLSKESSAGFISQRMGSHGTKDLESFKNHGENISGGISLVIQDETSVSDFSLEQKRQGSDAKANIVSQHDEPENCDDESTQNPTKAHDKEIDSLCQIMANTEKLDLESSPEEAGDPVVQQMPWTKGCDSSLIVKNDKKSRMLNPQISNMNICGTMSPPSIAADNQKGDLGARNCEEGKYFYYDTPLYEETGIWIPVSVPPMTKNEHEEWTQGFCSNGGYIPEAATGWKQCIGEDKELTMWDVVVEMLLVARGKLNALASGDIAQISWISTQLIEQAWKEMAQTLTEANFSNAQEILESEPPKWLPDSTASSCMLCSVRFHPIMCTRHHCRFCGGIFCSDCTKGRSLLPEKFRTGDPQRVCDVCCVRLESVQPYLMNHVSRAAQFPTHDLTDLSTLRSWVNFPWGQSMEYEIYKAANTIRSYAMV